MSAKKPFWRKPKTPKQTADGAKSFAFDRKIPYATQAEAHEVAEKTSHRVYRCSYGPHFHTAHLSGNQKFFRGAAA